MPTDLRIRRISRDELRDELARGHGVKLVNALGDWEFRAKHIPGSIRFDTPEQMLAGLERHDAIVVYCTNPGCLASVRAYELLVHRGYTNVRRYAGGIQDWEEAGLPLEGAQAAPDARSERGPGADPVDEANLESFPASDPPEWTGAHAGAPRVSPRDPRERG